MLLCRALWWPFPVMVTNRRVVPWTAQAKDLIYSDKYYIWCFG